MTVTHDTSRVQTVTDQWRPGALSFSHSRSRSLTSQPDEIILALTFSRKYGYLLTISNRCIRYFPSTRSDDAAATIAIEVHPKYRAGEVDAFLIENETALVVAFQGRQLQQFEAGDICPKAREKFPSVEGERVWSESRFDIDWVALCKRKEEYLMMLRKEGNISLIKRGKVYEGVAEIPKDGDDSAELTAMAWMEDDRLVVQDMSGKLRVLKLELDEGALESKVTAKLLASVPAAESFGGGFLKGLSAESVLIASFSTPRGTARFCVLDLDPRDAVTITALEEVSHQELGEFEETFRVSAARFALPKRQVFAIGDTLSEDTWLLEKTRAGWVTLSLPEIWALIVPVPDRGCASCLGLVAVEAGEGYGRQLLMTTRVGTLEEFKVKFFEDPEVEQDKKKADNEDSRPEEKIGKADDGGDSRGEEKDETSVGGTVTRAEEKSGEPSDRKDIREEERYCKTGGGEATREKEKSGETSDIGGAKGGEESEKVEDAKEEPGGQGEKDKEEGGDGRSVPVACPKAEVEKVAENVEAKDQAESRPDAESTSPEGGTALPVSDSEKPDPLDFPSLPLPPSGKVSIQATPRVPFQSVLDSFVTRTSGLLEDLNRRLHEVHDIYNADFQTVRDHISSLERCLKKSCSISELLRSLRGADLVTARENLRVAREKLAFLVGEKAGGGMSPEARQETVSMMRLREFAEQTMEFLESSKAMDQSFSAAVEAGGQDEVIERFEHLKQEVREIRDVLFPSLAKGGGAKFGGICGGANYRQRRRLRRRFLKEFIQNVAPPELEAPEEYARDAAAEGSQLFEPDKAEQCLFEEVQVRRMQFLSGRKQIQVRTRDPADDAECPEKDDVIQRLRSAVDLEKIMSWISRHEVFSPRDELYSGPLTDSPPPPETEDTRQEGQRDGLFPLPTLESSDDSSPLPSEVELYSSDSSGPVFPLRALKGVVDPSKTKSGTQSGESAKPPVSQTSFSTVSDDFRILNASQVSSQAPTKTESVGSFSMIGKSSSSAVVSPPSSTAAAPEKTATATAKGSKTTEKSSMETGAPRSKSLEVVTDEENDFLVVGTAKGAAAAAASTVPAASGVTPESSAPAMAATPVATATPGTTQPSRTAPGSSQGAQMARVDSEDMEVETQRLGEGMAGMGRGSDGLGGTAPLSQPGGFGNLTSSQSNNSPRKNVFGLSTTTGTAGGPSSSAVLPPATWFKNLPPARPPDQSQPFNAFAVYTQMDAEPSEPRKPPALGHTSTLAGDGYEATARFGQPTRTDILNPFAQLLAEGGGVGKATDTFAKYASSGGSSEPSGFAKYAAAHGTTDVLANPGSGFAKYANSGSGASGFGLGGGRITGIRNFDPNDPAFTQFRG